MVNKPMSSPSTMRHNSKIAGHSAKHNHHKERSSKDHNNKSHPSQKKDPPSVPSKSTLPPENQPTNPQNNPHPTETQTPDPKAPTTDPPFQPCRICQLDEHVLSSLKKSRKKSGTSPPCPNENISHKRDRDEDEYEVVDSKEAIDIDDQEDEYDPRNNQYVMVDSEDDEYNLQL